MAEFKSHMSFYDFVSSVFQWRYIRNSEQEEFLATVLETSETRRKELPKDTILWRAQNGHHLYEEGNNEEDYGSVEVPFSPERMKPLRHKASEGRANPIGISYLYTAMEYNTAIAEVRPWVGAIVSVAKLQVVKSLTLINCAGEKQRKTVYINEPSSKERETTVWQNINEAFSKPINPDEPKTNYVPTQVIAEMFRQNDFDGLLFKSSLGKGHNIVLFDLEV